MAYLKKIACILILESQGDRMESIQKLAEACIRFTPQIAIRKNEALFLEVGRSLSLFSVDTLRARILILAKYFGLSVKISFGSHPCLSLAKVYFPSFDKTEKFSNLPIEAAVYFLDPFEVNADENGKVHALIGMMKRLGVKTLDQFLHLPSESLGTRFGERAIRIYSFAQGLAEPAWRGFQPSLIIEECKELGDDDLEGMEVTLEPLLFSLKALIDRAMIRLVGLGQRASRILIELKVSPWSTVESPLRVWDISLPVPQGTSVGILPIIRERLSFELSRKPLLSPAKFLKFKISESVPGHESQRDFFHSKDTEAETWDRLLGRLMSQLGEGHVFHAELMDSYRPETNWTRTLIPKEKRQKKDRKCRVSFRPSRILKEPEPLLLKPALILHSKGHVWKVRRWDGPERISVEWWAELPEKKVNRDYYRVTTQENEKLWIFLDRDIQPPQAFLHGYFD